MPVNADFEGGYAVEPRDVAANVTSAVATGIAGLSIEDSTGDEADPLYEFELAVERIRAARRAIDASGTGVVLTGRSEGFVVGRPDIDETIRRLQAYAEAGADCLYAPRISERDHVVAIVAAVAPKPVNLLVNAPFITVAEAAAMGVRRISVGGTLARSRLGRVPAGGPGDGRGRDLLPVRGPAERRRPASLDGAVGNQAGRTKLYLSAPRCGRTRRPTAGSASTGGP